MSEFTVKDSGARQQFESGMVRDTTDNKVDFGLVLDGPMFHRWAEHLTKGAKKYAKRNWMKANGMEEYDRFRESALRHFLQWYNGERDEDHASAVYFNINGAEYVLAKKETEIRKSTYKPVHDNPDPERKEARKVAAAKAQATKKARQASQEAQGLT